jgi:hypothetical protein
MKDRFRQIIENADKERSGFGLLTEAKMDTLSFKCEALAVEMMEKLGDWILKEGFERLRDGERVWWGKFTDEIDFTTSELIAKFLSEKP